jgi:hypothetical protein
MECPFCAESIKDEAVACKHCSRDLSVSRPVMLEVQEIVSELDRLRRELDTVQARFYRMQHPVRNTVFHAMLYLLLPTALLVTAHIIVTIILDVNPLYLRLASFVIPLPFGFALYARDKVGIRGAMLVGALMAILAVTCMLTVTGLNDHVPIMPGPWVEWREVIEYTASVALAFDSGHILGFLIFQVLPKTMVHGGKPNALAYRLARGLGQHLGDEQLRRRARTIQDLLRTVGPLAGIAMTAGGSIYTGLKGVFGW